MLHIEAKPALRQLAIRAGSPLSRDEVRAAPETIRAEAGKLVPGWIGAIDLRELKVLTPDDADVLVGVQKLLNDCGAGRLATLVNSAILTTQLARTLTASGSRVPVERFTDEADWRRCLSR